VRSKATSNPGRTCARRAVYRPKAHSGLAPRPGPTTWLSVRPPHPGLKSWAGRPCPCGTADRFSAVEEILLVEFESSWASRAVPQGQGPPAQGFNPGSRGAKGKARGSRPKRSRHPPGQRPQPDGSDRSLLAEAERSACATLAPRRGRGWRNAGSGSEPQTTGSEPQTMGTARVSPSASAIRYLLTL